MLSFTTLENMLVLKYYDPSILLFLTPTYPTALFSAGLGSELLNYSRKAVRTINFQSRNSHNSALFK